MIALTESQRVAVKDGILHLTYDSVAPESVDIATEEGSDGPSIVVTIRLRATDGTGQWDPNDFLAIRRESRTIALEEFGSSSDVRLLYESASPAPLEEDTEQDSPSDKKSPEL